MDRRCADAARATVAVAVACLLSNAAVIAGTLNTVTPIGFIPVSNPVDIAYDAARETLYVTTATKVLRFSLRDHRFGQPISVGSDLKGIDLAPDGSFLVVADDANNGASTWVHLVDPDDGDVQTLTFDADPYERGTWSVVAVDNHTLLTTSDFEGSGWVPFRRVDLVTGEVRQIAQVTQWTMLAADDSRDIIGLAQGNISDGRWGRYTVSTDTYQERDGYQDGTSWFNYEIAVDGAGDQFAIPTYGGTFLFDAALQHARMLGKYATDPALAAAYDPVDGSLYLSIGWSSRVDRYDPATGERLGSINIHHALDWSGNLAYVNGRMKLSPDGSILFVTTSEGIATIRSPRLRMGGPIPPARSK